MLFAVLASTLFAQEPLCLEGVAGSGSSARRTVVEVTRANEAVVHFYGRPARRTSLARLSENDNEFASSDGSVRLILRGDSSSVELPVAERTTRVTLRRAVPPQQLVGKREWNARVGPGGVIRMDVRVDRGPCGLLTGVLDSPDQGQMELPLTHLIVTGDTLVVGADYMGLRLAIPLANAEEVTGSMTQNGVTTPIVLRRGARELIRPQEPRGPLPYDARDVSFRSRAGIQLHGTLTVPRGGGRHPAIVLISGSGAQDRDEQIAGHRPFLVLSDHLTRRGYAVLRTDDRGVGGTAGSVTDADLHVFAEDVRGAIDFLARQPDVDSTRLGLLGHSEGGYVAPIVAAQDTRVRHLILLGAPAHAGREIMLMQRAAMTRGNGASERRVRVDSAMLATIFSVLDTHLESAALPDAVDSALAAWLSVLDSADGEIAAKLLAGRTAAADSNSLALWRTPLFRGLYRHDPGPFLVRTDVPVFALIGALDLQVPARPAAQKFRSLYEGERARLLAFHTPEGVNHMLQPARTGRMDEYVQIETTIATSVLELLDAWLSATVPTNAKGK